MLNIRVLESMKLSCLQLSTYCNIFDCASGTKAQKGLHLILMQVCLERDGDSSSIYYQIYILQTADYYGFYR